MCQTKIKILTSTTPKKIEEEYERFKEENKDITIEKRHYQFSDRIHAICIEYHINGGLE